MYKVLAKISRNRLSSCHSEVVGEYEGVFGKGMSMTDHICTMKLLQNQSYEQNWVCTYYSIERIKLYEVMVKLNIPTKLIRIVKMTLLNSQNM